MRQPINRKPFRTKPVIRSTGRRKTDKQQAFLFEAEVVDGLVMFAREELAEKLAAHIRIVSSQQPATDSVQFYYSGGLQHLLSLKTIQSIYLIRNFDIPRPRALLGNEQFQNLQRDIAAVIQLSPPDTYQTFYVSAAGSDSSVMVRLKEGLARATGLSNKDDEGDLLLRLRRGLNGRDWQTLVRLTPRPLATRAWRVCNFPGALNASVAHVMALLTRPKPDDVFVNLACGSGTLMIERLAALNAQCVVGCDINPDVLQCARTNLASSRLIDDVRLIGADAAQLPFTENSVSAICADLPFGNLVGSHDTNLSFYPALLDDAARVAKRGARFVLITHELRLMQDLLGQQHEWRLETTVPITLTGLHPRIYVLVKN